jgi:uncharacterized membrane protein YfcA
LLEALLTAIAGFVGGFVSTLASNGSAVTLPALEFLGLPEHVAIGRGSYHSAQRAIEGSAMIRKRIQTSAT